MNRRPPRYWKVILECGHDLPCRKFFDEDECPYTVGQITHCIVCRDGLPGTYGGPPRRKRVVEILDG